RAHACMRSLYEMLAGRTPFEDNDVIRIMAAHASAGVPAFRDLVPDVAVPMGSAFLIVTLGQRKHRVADDAAYCRVVDFIVAPAAGGPGRRRNPSGYGCAALHSPARAKSGS